MTLESAVGADVDVGVGVGVGAYADSGVIRVRACYASDGDARDGVGEVADGAVRDGVGEVTDGIVGEYLVPSGAKRPSKRGILIGDGVGFFSGEVERERSRDGELLFFLLPFPLPYGELERFF